MELMLQLQLFKMSASVAPVAAPLLTIKLFGFNFVITLHLKCPAAVYTSSAVSDHLRRLFDFRLTLLTDLGSSKTFFAKENMTDIRANPSSQYRYIASRKIGFNGRTGQRSDRQLD